MGVTNEIHWKDIETKLRAYAFPNIPEISTSTMVNQTGQHIMISYCPAQKVMVTLLAVYLRDKHGYDVWMNDSGSTLCSKMLNEIDDHKRAEAVEKSHIVLVFVSKEYHESEHCQKEAQYAHDQSRVKIYYVLLQQEYTTVSSPDRIEGQLRLWMGEEKGYPLYHVSQVSNTGDIPAELIGEQGKLVATAVGGGVVAIRALSPRI